jgi:hypothetical protein
MLTAAREISETTRVAGSAAWQRSCCRGDRLAVDHPLSERRNPTMRNISTLLGVVTFCVLALTAIGVGAQTLQPTSETYSWSGELVGFDANGRTVTVKSPVFGDQAIAEVARFNPGDRIILTWSGYDTYADSISRAVRYEAGKKWNEPFTFPVEFVAYESPRRYLTFKFQVPAGSVEALKSLKPGEWVTATSRHRPSSETEAITAVNAYTASSSRISTN